MLNGTSARFEFEGEEYTVSCDMTVISAFETTHGYSLIDVVSPPGGGNPLISRLYLLLQAALEPEHPGLCAKLVARMISHQPALTALLTAVKTALPVAGDVPGDAAGNASNRAERRAATKAARAGKTGSSSASKPG